MKKSIILIESLVLILTASCASYNKTTPMLGVNSNNINTYVAADLDYQNAQKVEGTVEYEKLLWIIPLKRNGNKTVSSSNRYKGLSNLESKALYKALENSKADIIVEPQFEKEHHSWFFGIYQKGSAKAKGWGVKINGLKEDTNKGVLPNSQVSVKTNHFGL